MEYCSKNSKYFVMKLQDEFNMDDLLYYFHKYIYDAKMSHIGTIKGLDLSLLILNSISDKSKLL